MDFLYSYECSADIYSLSSGKQQTINKPFPLLSTDRLSTVRYRLAKHLGVDPSMLYTEVQSGDGPESLVVVPFQYSFHDKYSRQYTEEASQRVPPDQYAQ